MTPYTAKPTYFNSRLWNNPKQRDIWSQFLELLLPWGKPKSIVIYVIIKCKKEKNHIKYVPTHTRVMINKAKVSK